MKKRSMILAAAMGLGLASMSQASTIYSYVAQSTNPGGGIINGTSNTVNLYLQEVTTGTSYITSDGGLYAGGVALYEQPGGTGVTVSSVSNNTSPEPTGFTGSNNNGMLTNGGAYILDITNNNDTTAGVAPVSTTTSGGTTTSLYLLGSVTLGVSATPNAHFLVESLHNVPAGDGAGNAGKNGNTLTFNSGTDLDPDNSASTIPGGSSGANSNPTSLAITSSVPEPASLAVFGLGAVGVLARRRRAMAK